MSTEPTGREPSHQGQRVLVTAGGAGIGRAVAEAFSAQRAKVHICDVDAERLSACEAEIPNLTTTLADVSDPAQVDALFDEALERLGGLDVLVNNAGIAGPTAPVEEISPAAWEQTMAVNINGQFYCARRAVPLLKAAGGGNIVNLSSSAGLFGYPRRSPYAASKWAVIGFTKTLAMELGPAGISVNAICPGAVDGPRMDRVIAAESEASGRPPEEVRRGYLEQTSLRTFVDRGEVATLILYLCSPAGRNISGQALSIDGNTETLRL